jgi:putative lipoprotein
LGQLCLKVCEVSANYGGYLSMMKKVFIFSAAIALSGCFAGKHKVQALPDAELNKPYFIELNVTKYAAYPDNFRVKMDPLNSGLTVKPTDEWYDTVHISGTPQTKQDITIEISYYIRGSGGFLGLGKKNHKKFYQIKVKE